MKNATAATVTKLKEAYDIQTSLRVIAEWNMNRYGTIASVSNGLASSPIQDLDGDNFPIDSITNPIRPRSGIVKARAATMTHMGGIGADGFVKLGYTSTPNNPRYVTVSPDSLYKYWSSPSQSTGTAFAPTTSPISNVQPTVIYSSNIWTNKIVVCIENTYTKCDVWNIQITTNGTTWTTVSTNAAIPTDGRVSIYRQADGTWGNTIYRENPMQIRGVRINVTSMTKSRVYFSLIELSPRLESDLSAYVVNYSNSMEMSEHSFVAPLGKASANTAMISLSNFDNRFSNSNNTSLYYGLIDKNVEVRVDVGISNSPYSAPVKTYDWIRQFTMYTDTWEGQDQDTTQMHLQDASMQLQQIKPLKVVYQSLTVAEIMWRMLDSIGFTNYVVEGVDIDAITRIPYFWTNGEKTVWEIFTELTQQTQNAAWFDEYGILQIKNRNAALNLQRPVEWAFEGNKNGNTLSNIVTLEKTNDYEANKVNVSYRDTSVSTDTAGVVPMEVVWQPEGDLVLRGSNLTQSITTTSPSIRISPYDVKTWPFTGVVQIEGEFMRYTAKGYTYYNAAGVLTSAYINDEGDRANFDKLNPSKSFMNYYNGYLWIGLANRGLWSSVPKAHTVDVAGYVTRGRYNAGTPFLWGGGWTHEKNLGRARMMTTPAYGHYCWYTATRGSEFDTPPNYYGTRMLFHSAGYTYGFAGLAISAGSTYDAGYYVELFQTDYYNTMPTARNNTNELNFYVRYTGGNIKRFGLNGGKGVPMLIARNTWYDIDVNVNWGYPGGPFFTIFVNGVLRMQVQVPNAEKPSTGTTGRWGVFARGYTKVDFEYLYGTSASEAVTFDEGDLYDRIRSDYVSSQLTKEWIYNTRPATRLRGKTKIAYTQRYNQLVVDEFGAGVHEVREMDVKFEKPVLHSRPYISNDSRAIIPEYNGSSFGASFVLANMTRGNAILNGTDETIYGPDNPVEQKTLIYGRVITQGDPQVVTVQNDAAIKRRGESSVDIGGDWIQSKATATAISTWVNRHWSGGVDEIKIETFCNPLITVGDLVSVNYAASYMTPSVHRYFVVKVDQSYDNGLETNVTLRRAKI